MPLARGKTREVMVGGIVLGGGAPVAVQSMTNVPMCSSDEGPVLDVGGNLAQIERLVSAGCEIVRVAVPNKASVAPFAQLVERSSLPVVADVHFDHEIAIGVIRGGAAKVRINPGNIGDMCKVDAVIDEAGAAGIPLRIGVNAGSLDREWRDRVDLTLPERLVGSARSFVEHFERRGFYDVLVSAKTHDVGACIETYRLLSREVPQVPLHLGITEAGTLVPGTVKAAYGLGTLLAEGIGDTLRVSLTDDPVCEVEVAWEILAATGLRRLHAELVSCPTCSRCQVDLIPIATAVGEHLKSVRVPIKVAVMGCAVNGPGEARDADVGVACGADCGVLFVKGRPLRKVPAGGIVEALCDEVDRIAGEHRA